MDIAYGEETLNHAPCIGRIKCPHMSRNTSALVMVFHTQITISMFESYNLIEIECHVVSYF